MQFRNTQLSLFLPCLVFLASWACGSNVAAQVTEPATSGTQPENILVRSDLFEPLTEPPCSYCVNQNLKNLIRPDDIVLAWIRGKHNGGAMPLRHFIAAPRVVNDTYGLFFYDPDGGYVASFEKDYGYRFYGWRGGVMIAEGRDGTLWSALSGKAIDGPQKGKQLVRVPSMLTTWQHWLMLHPESTAYDLFDGNKYPVAELPTEISADAESTIANVDERLDSMTMVMGIDGENEQLAVPLDGMMVRDCRNVEIDGNPVTVFWYGLTKSAVAFSSTVDGQKLTFYADEISPETAPFKDRETGTRWTLAGRAVDGELRGKELEWAPSIACRWYAWSHEYPQTKVSTVPYTGLIVSAAQVVPTEFENWRLRANSIALVLTSPDNRAEEMGAAVSIAAAGFDLEYFIEVGRSPELARQRPDWMASLQGHQEWRRLFPDFPEPGENQVVKNEPWVPILYRESFDAHVQLIAELLEGMPTPTRIWLNDLQGAPSACGCGHPLCRWTADYGPIKTATPLDHTAAAEFVAAIAKLAPHTQIVPILTSECEEADKDEVCCGVNCFEGKCWTEFTKQLDSVAAESDQMGVACFYREYKRDLPRYGSEAGWVNFAISSFSEVPRLRAGKGVPAHRLIAVLQGWDVTDALVQAQIDIAKQAGTAGTLLSLAPIDQSWKPVMFDLLVK